MGHRALSPQENEVYISIVSGIDKKCIRNSEREQGEVELKQLWRMGNTELKGKFKG